MRRVSGTGPIGIYNGDGNNRTQIGSQVTTSWKQISVGPFPSNNSGRAGILAETSGDIIEVFRPQTEVVDGRWAAQNLRPRSDVCDNPTPGDAAWNYPNDINPFGVLSVVGELEITTTINPRAFNFSENVGPRSRVFVSFYAKADEGTTTAEPLFDGIGSIEFVVGGPNAGTVQNVGAGILSYGMKPAKAGWWRVWVEGYVPTTGLTRIFYRVPFAEEVIGNKMRFFGEQLEIAKPNQTEPSPYFSNNTDLQLTDYRPANFIPTTTAAVTNQHQDNDGLRREEGRTNECLYSKDYTQAATWIPNNAIVTGSYAIAPDGSETACRLAPQAMLI